jgi:hypothetical protein
MCLERRAGASDEAVREAAREPSEHEEEHEDMCNIPEI